MSVVMGAMPSDQGPELGELFRAQRGALWGLAYRLTGSTEDAEDVVQEAFVRLLANPPEASLEELGRWLSRVVTNLGIDVLRRRRRRQYVGPWLPSPIKTDDSDPFAQLVSESPDPERRYGMLESAGFAFLLALETLSPRQRAALLFRDVLGCSARETAEVLGTTEGSVRVLHMRARRALAPYEESRCVPTAELRARHQLVLERFLDCLIRQDAPGLMELLTESVSTITDAAGEFTALATPLAGRQRVARLYLVAAATRQEGDARTEILVVNGLPAALITLGRPDRRQAPRTLLNLELDASDRIRCVHAVLAPRKLAALRG